jgi:hypothetical protein
MITFFEHEGHNPNSDKPKEIQTRRTHTCPGGRCQGRSRRKTLKKPFVYFVSFVFSLLRHRERQKIVDVAKPKDFWFSGICRDVPPVLAAVALPPPSSATAGTTTTAIPNEPDFFF